MVREVSTSLSVSLDEGSTNIPFKWEPHEGVFSLDGFRVKLRLFPRVLGVKVRTSHGTADKLPALNGQITKREFLIFQGTDTANTEYPVSHAPSFDTSGSLLDLDGDPIGGISFQYNAKTATIRASKAFYGVVMITYVSNYEVYDYAPLQTGTYSYEYGNIIAFKDGSVAQHTVQPPDFQDPKNEAELYRVYSRVHVNRYGAWEVPKEFPDVVLVDPQAPQTDQDNYYEYERTHEIGYIRTIGAYVFEDSFGFAPEQGVEKGGYRPPFYYRENLDQLTTDPVFGQAAINVNISTVRSRVAGRYPGIDMSGV